jgi:hypothetical protein
MMERAASDRVDVVFIVGMTEGMVASLTNSMKQHHPEREGSHREGIIEWAV